MLITHKIKMDLGRRDIVAPVNVVQGDTNTRAVEISLYASGAAWTVPAGVSALVRYRKPDGTGGTYDTLPDGSTAWSTDGNTVTVTLAPQVLTVPGVVLAQVEMSQGQLSIATFTIKIHVERDPSIGTIKSEEYVNMSRWISDEVNHALTEAKESGDFDGPAGPQGEHGPAGAAGKNGKSAYQYAQEGGYAGTEEEFTQKLAETPLIGDTGTITPRQVYDAILGSREILIVHIDKSFGALAFASFNAATLLSVVFSSSVVWLNGVYGLCELVGNMTSDTWQLMTTQLAEHKDIPTPVIGTTATVTPSQVKALMDAGKPFAITHTDSAYG